VLELLLTVDFLDGVLFAVGVTKYELIIGGLGGVKIMSGGVDDSEVLMGETGDNDRTAEFDSDGEVSTNLKSESKVRVNADIFGIRSANLTTDDDGVPSEFKLMTGATWEAFEVELISTSGLNVVTAGLLSSWLEAFVSI
jgi:hypothetical protein